MSMLIFMVGTTLPAISSISPKSALAESQPYRAVTYNTEDLEPGQIMTPWGPTDAKNVHDWNGTAINIDAELAKDPVKRIELRPHESTGHAPTDGYQEWADWTAPSQITVFDGNWVVPAAPSSTYTTNQVLYLFTGLEPSDSSFILQPVLEYGQPKDMSLCNCWRIQSWMVLSNNQYYRGSAVTVSAGDTIIGHMVYESSTTWTVQATDQNTNGQSTLTATTSAQLPYAIDALETYNIPTNTCNDLSGNEDFYNLKLNLGALTPSWTGHYINQGWCHIQNPTINSASDVLIHTQS